MQFTIYHWPVIGFVLRILHSLWGTMSCRIFMHLTSDQFERHLHIDERISQKLHRKICETCRTQERHLKQMHELSGELDMHKKQFSDREMSVEAKARIAQAVDAASSGQKVES